MSLNKERTLELNELCNSFRKDLIKVLHLRQTGHPGGSLSVCEILTSLYFEKANITVENQNDDERDRVILSKGHAAPMLYRILAEKGFFPVEEMESLRKLNSRLQGHPCSKHTPGVELSTGPLGLGLSAGIGMALGQKSKGFNSYVYVVLGDGELNEGTIWEATMSAYKFKVNNLIAIIDNNDVQLDGTCEEIMPKLDILKKFEAFGWNTLECNGHDISSICDAIDEAKKTNGLPTVIVANTIKGKGISFMEGKNIWHGKPINDNEFDSAMKELGGCDE